MTSLQNASGDPVDRLVERAVMRAWRTYLSAYREREALRYAADEAPEPAYTARVYALAANMAMVRAQTRYVIAVGSNLGIDVSDWSPGRLFSGHPVTLHAVERRRATAGPVPTVTSARVTL